MLDRLDKIQAEIKEWSFRNFGWNWSKSPESRDSMCLKSLAPLLGMVEEMGEYWSADSTQDMDDAVADFCIFLLDYLWRENIKPSEIWTSNIDNADIKFPPVVQIGKLCHITLKRHQGIRGYDNIDFYKEKQKEILQHLIYNLTYHYKDLVDIIEQTWSKVKERDWIKNKNANIT